MAGEVPYNAPVTFAGPDGPKQYSRAVQVTDSEHLMALAEKLNQRQRPVLFVQEHNDRYEDGDTSALAWGLEWKVGEIDHQGKPTACLLCRASETAGGAPVFRGGDLRYVSPSLDVARYPGQESAAVPRVYPVDLKSVGVTNAPRAKMPPITEPISDDAPAILFNSEAVSSPEPEPKNENQKPKPMNEIAKKLGLAEGATEAEILAAIAKLQESQAAAEGKAADTFVATNSDVIPAAKKADYRARYLANAADAESLVADLREAKQSAAATAAATNKETVTETPRRVVAVFHKENPPQTPGEAINGAVRPEDKRDAADHAAVFNSMPAGPARSAYYRKYKSEIASAS